MSKFTFLTAFYHAPWDVAIRRVFHWKRMALESCW